MSVALAWGRPRLAVERVTVLVLPVRSIPCLHDRSLDVVHLDAPIRVIRSLEYASRELSLTASTAPSIRSYHDLSVFIGD
jgi:hypothetical protein